MSTAKTEFSSFAMICRSYPFFRLSPSPPPGSPFDAPAVLLKNIIVNEVIQIVIVIDPRSLFLGIESAAQRGNAAAVLVALHAVGDGAVGLAFLRNEFALFAAPLPEPFAQQDLAGRVKRDPRRVDGRLLAVPRTQITGEDLRRDIEHPDMLFAVRRNGEEPGLPGQHDRGDLAARVGNDQHAFHGHVVIPRIRLAAYRLGNEDRLHTEPAGVLGGFRGARFVFVLRHGSRPGEKADVLDLEPAVRGEPGDGGDHQKNTIYQISATLLDSVRNYNGIN